MVPAVDENEEVENWETNQHAPERRASAHPERRLSGRCIPDPATKRAASSVRLSVHHVVCFVHARHGRAGWLDGGSRAFGDLMSRHLTREGIRNQ